MSDAMTWREVEPGVLVSSGGASTYRIVGDEDGDMDLELYDPARDRILSWINVHLTVERAKALAQEIEHQDAIDRLDRED